MAMRATLRSRNPISRLSSSTTDTWQRTNPEDFRRPDRGVTPDDVHRFEQLQPMHGSVQSTIYDDFEEIVKEISTVLNWPRDKRIGGHIITYTMYK
jgi:hypothetical protein